MRINTERDPYADWYMVYRAEVVDKIRSFPVSRRLEAEDGILQMTTPIERVRT